MVWGAVAEEVAVCFAVEPGGLYLRGAGVDWAGAAGVLGGVGPVGGAVVGADAVVAWAGAVAAGAVERAGWGGGNWSGAGGE